MSDRLEVRKTYKLFVGGAFPRSESGRTYEVVSADGTFLANAAKGSRKDGRDAVLAARKAVSGWSAATAYNRGQVLYRVAEVMEGRRAQFVADVRDAEGVDEATAGQQVDAAIDRWVWYAGWADKLAQVLGSANPVAGPYFNFSIPEPSGVVVAVAPQDSSLLGLVSVDRAGHRQRERGDRDRQHRPSAPGRSRWPSRSPPATSPAASSTSSPATRPRSCRGSPPTPTSTRSTWPGIDDPDLATMLEREAAGTMTRVRRPEAAADWAADPGLSRIRSFVETKTVWHPMGV